MPTLVGFERKGFDTNGAIFPLQIKNMEYFGLRLLLGPNAVIAALADHPDIRLA
jgi:hypothetical protein